MAKFSPSDAALEGFRLTKEHPGVMLAWSAVYFGGILLIALAMMATLGPQFIALAKKGQLTGADLETVGGLLAQSWPAFALVLVMTAGLMSIITAGVLRLVLQPQVHGFAHLKIGREELRLTLANLACIAFYVGSLILAVVLTGAAGRSSPMAGGVAAVVVITVAVWVGVRLALLLPSVFATGRISFPEAWSKTRGHFWKLFGMIILAVIFYVIVWTLFSIIGLAVVELSGGEAALQDITRLTPLTAIAAMVTLVMQLLLQILQIVMIYAPFAVAYRDLGQAAVTPGNP